MAVKACRWVGAIVVACCAWGWAFAQPSPALQTADPSVAVVAPVERAGPAVPAPSAAVVAAPLTRPTLVGQETLNGADTAWMLTSTALVLLMTLPGLALFYAGMVRRKSVLNTMASVVAITALVSLLWFAVGYSIAFTPGNGWVGTGDRMWFSGLDYVKEGGKIAWILHSSGSTGFPKPIFLTNYHIRYLVSLIQ
ncbi:MAG: ammonium transporter [Comamonadaceae bacterium]|nr:MAG: ammonium transporter [Comamonadaceae bacterium]